MGDDFKIFEVKNKSDDVFGITMRSSTTEIYGYWLNAWSVVGPLDDIVDEAKKSGKVYDQKSRIAFVKTLLKKIDGKYFLVLKQHTLSQSKWNTNTTPFENDVRRGNWAGMNALKMSEDSLIIHVLERVKKGLEKIKSGNLLNPQNGEILDKEKLESDSAWIVTQLMLQSVFKSFGRPTYLVSKSVIDVVKTFEISEEDKLSIFENLPYPVLCLVFERGTFSDAGDEIVSVFISKSEIGRDVFKNGTVRPKCTFSFVFNSIRTYAVDFKSDKTLSEIPISGNLKMIMRVSVALMLLWRARPHFVKTVTLPRSERYAFKGDRKQIRQWVFPTELITRVGESVAGNGTKKPHWRGGHFRHYRNERYGRNQDGSVKVDFIEPMFIGVEKE